MSLDHKTRKINCWLSCCLTLQLYHEISEQINNPQIEICKTQTEKKATAKSLKRMRASFRQAEV